MTDAATIRASATRLHHMGLNVNLLGGDKHPIHKWKSTPDYTKAYQTDAEFASLPWNGYTRRDGVKVAPPVGNAIISGPGDGRVLDLDKCTDPAILRTMVLAMDLDADYGWQYRSGSHRGYGVVVVCPDAIPDSLASLFVGGILVGTPRDGAEFKQLELRYTGCQTVVPPSLHPSGNAYEWLYGEPTPPPATVTIDQLMAGFLAIAELPAKPAQPVPQPTVAAPAKRYSAEDSASAREYVNAIIAKVCLDTDPGAVLEQHGARLVGRRGQMRDYSGVTGDEHSNKITYTVSPAKNGKGWIAKSKSPSGKLNKTDYPRGFNGYDALVVLAGKTWRDFAPAPKETKTLPSKVTPAPAPTIDQATAYNAARREKRHAENRQALEAITNLPIIGELTARARSLANHLLGLAHDAGVLQVRPTNEQLADALGYCRRYVSAAFREIETSGLGKRHGGRGGMDQPNEAAIWTFYRSPSLGCKARPNAECNLDIDILDLSTEPVLACEGGLGGESHERACDPADLDTWQWCEAEPDLRDVLNALECPKSPDLDNSDKSPAPDPSEKIQQGRAAEQQAKVNRILEMTDAELAALVAEPCNVQLDVTTEPLVPAEPGASYTHALDWTVPTSENVFSEVPDPRAVPSWLRVAGDIRMERREDGEPYSGNNPELNAPGILYFDDPDPLVRCPPTDPAAAQQYHKLRGAARKATSSEQRRLLLDKAAALEEWRPVSEAIGRHSQAKPTRGPRSALSPPMLPLFAGGGT